MNFDLNEITSVIPIVFAIIAIVVYYFDKIIVDLSPHEPEIRDNYISGIFFTIIYILFPFLFSVGVIFIIVEFLKIDPNELAVTFGTTILLVTLSVLLFICMRYIFLKLKSASETDSEISPIEEKYSSVILGLYSLIPSFIIYSIGFLIYYVYLNTPTHNILIPALYYSLLFFTAFILYTSIATIYGLHVAEYPYAKIVLLTGQPQLEGNIRKFGKQLELVNDYATYHINMDNISFIEITHENK